jgi:hypothetical protein
MLHKMRDAATGRVEQVELSSGKVYDQQGAFVRQMIPQATIAGPGGAEIPLTALSDYAARCYGENMAKQYRKPITMSSREADGRLVTMDLSVSDVHIAAALPNYAAGYQLAEGCADIASPPILVPKQSDKYFTWDSANEFKRKFPNASSPGGAVAEINPTLSNDVYSTAEYALAAFVPTEVQSNADSPLRPFQKAVQMIMTNLLLERELRVATLLQTSGSWTSGNVQTLASGAQWDGGAASDPVLNLHTAIENSFLPITGIIWSELVEHDFVRNPAVQKYVGYKTDMPGIPSMAEFASTLRLPPIYTAKMKYTTNGGTLTYVWGNHVVLLHQPPEQPPTSQQDVATTYTFRWNGGEAPDGAMTAGFLVRSFFDPKRGPRGGTTVIVVHNDAEKMTSTVVGALILNAHR